MIGLIFSDNHLINSQIMFILKILEMLTIILLKPKIDNKHLIKETRKNNNKIGFI